jgi:general secretion pathway protein G
MTRRTRNRLGFTLVELVVVILIIGILAAVAAPRMFDSANNARENGTRHSLSVLRDAVELYKAENGSYPAAATLATDLKPFLKSAFPEVQVGANKNANVASTVEDPITTVVGGGAGWVYNETTGDLAVNDAAYIAW